MAAKWTGFTRVIFYTGAVALFLIILLFVFIIVAKRDDEGYTSSNADTKETTRKNLGGVGVPRETDFIIYNHLTLPVAISFAQIPNGALIPSDPIFGSTGEESLKTAEISTEKTEILIPSNEQRSLKAYESKLFTPLKEGRRLLVVDTLVEGVKIPYALYTLDYPVKALHIGMVTSRVLEPEMEDHQLVANRTGGMVGGVPWVTIRNPTLQKLEFTNGLVVPPMETRKYLGRHHYGVSLGTWFKERSGLYPDFQLLKPETSIWYGVISDNPQNTFGGEDQGQFTDLPTLPPSDWMMQTL